jgi:hypothetical protein
MGVRVGDRWTRIAAAACVAAGMAAGGAGLAGALAGGRTGGQPELPAMGGPGILVFIDVHYGGENATFRRDVPDLGEYRLCRRISSFRLAPGEAWEVCERPDYEGRCQVFTDSQPDLRVSRWNDRICSMRRIGGRGAGRPGRPGFPQPFFPPGTGIVLYSETSFEGDFRTFDREVTDLQDFGFNDRARSVRVLWGTWEICRDNYFRNCRRITGDESDLDRMNLSRRVSSLRPVEGGPGSRPR